MNAYWKVGTVAAVVLLAWLWGQHRYSDGYDNGYKLGQESVVVVPETVLVPPKVIEIQGKTRIVRDTITIEHDRPVVEQTIAEAETSITLSSGDSAYVAFDLKTTYFPKQVRFRHDIKNVGIFYHSEMIIRKEEIYRRDPWYLRPLAAIGSGALVWGLVKDKPVVAGVGGAVAFYALVLEF